MDSPLSNVMPGDLVECIKPVNFTDGRFHRVGQLIEVTEDTKWYYRHSMQADAYKIVRSTNDTGSCQT